MSVKMSVFLLVHAHSEYHLCFYFFFLATFDRGNIASFHHLLELHIIPAALFCCHGLTCIADENASFVKSLVWVFSDWFICILPCVCFSFLTLISRRHPFEAWKHFSTKMYCFVSSKDTILSVIPLSVFKYCLSNK